MTPTQMLILSAKFPPNIKSWMNPVQIQTVVRTTNLVQQSIHSV